MSEASARIQASEGDSAKAKQHSAVRDRFPQSWGQTGHSDSSSSPGSSLFQHSTVEDQPATQRYQQPAGSITTTLGVRPAVTLHNTGRPLLDKLGVNKAQSSDSEQHRVSTHRRSVRQQQQQQSGSPACFSTTGSQASSSSTRSGPRVTILGVSLSDDTAQRRTAP